MKAALKNKTGKNRPGPSFQITKITETRGVYQDLDKNQWLSADGLRDLQGKRVRALIQHAYDHVSYYRRLLNQSGINPENFQLEDLQKIPFLKKSTIQREIESLVASNYPRHLLQRDSTGGSTGNPISFYRDSYANVWLGEAAKRFRRWIGYSPEDKLALIWGADRDIPSEYPPNELWLNSFSLSPKKIDAFIEELLKFRPRALRGYASALYLVASYLKSRGFQPPFPLAKGIESSAEILWNWQRPVIEEIFGCKVFNMYGSREVPSIACECEYHQGLHTFDDIRIVEIIKDGRQAKPGETGSIVITDLLNYGMPLIRYEIGDLGLLAEEDCVCGRGFRLLKEIKGRVTSTITLPDGRLIHGEYFTHLFYDKPGIDSFQVHQLSLNRIEINIKPGPSFKPDIMEGLIGQILDNIGQAVQVSWRLVDEIPPAPSGKYHFTISEVPVQFTSQNEASLVQAHHPAQSKPRILLIADVPNWIFARHCKTLQTLLADEFDFSIKFNGEPFNEDDYDLIYPLEWNLVSPNKNQKPYKYITGIRSHLGWPEIGVKKFSSFLATHFQSVHVVSKRLYDLFSSYLPSVQYVTHGIDTKFFTPENQPGESKDRVRLGWAGNRKSVSNKGFNDIIEPLSRLPGVELVFCGYSDRNLSQEEMRAFYESIDIYICASEYEGNNNSLLEAAAMQRAIITTDNGTVPEYLRHGESALIVSRSLDEFKKAVRKLQRNPRLRKEMGQRARQAVVNAWDWEVKAEEYRRFFRQALKKAREYALWTRIADADRTYDLSEYAYLLQDGESQNAPDSDPQGSPAEVHIVKRMLEHYQLEQLFPQVDWEGMPRNWAEATAYYQAALILLNYGAFSDACFYLRKSDQLAPSMEVDRLLKTLHGKVDSIAGSQRNNQGQLKEEGIHQAQDQNEQISAIGQGRKILFIVHGFPPYSMAGTELYSYQLARELRKRGDDIRVLYPEFDPSRPEGVFTHDVYEGIPVVRLNLRSPETVEQLFRSEPAGRYLADYLRANPVDLVHIQHLLRLGAEVLRTVSDMEIPQVMTLHDTWFLCDQIHLIYSDGSYCQEGPVTAGRCVDCFAKRNPNFPIQSYYSQVEAAFRLRKQYLRESLGQIDTLITPSHFIRDLFETHGFNHPDFQVAPLGLNEFIPLPHRPAKGVLRFTYLGNIFLIKGLDLAVQAFNQLWTKKARFDIYGQVCDPGYFEQVMGAVKPGLVVKYHGGYKPEDLPHILARTDIAVIPSRIENYSLVIRECLQAGVPVIGPDIGGVPEMIRAGENGLLFRPGDSTDLAEKMRFFLDHPEQVSEFRKRIPPVRTMSEDADRLESIYEQAIRRKKRTGATVETSRVISTPSLPASSQVDIVIPIYGHADMVRRCVESVLKTAPDAHLILIDDCSPGDEIQRLYKTWEGHSQITLARTATNSGFIGACKLGATLGQAPFILFLNSDTEALEPGWLQRLIPEQKDVAIVGAKLLYPPTMPGPLAGCLQHAGVACNAHGQPYHPFLGRPADLPEANQARWVNAVTGACFLIRRKVWEELGGWDPRFGKGVFEDVDLCWQARHKGYRILYQPAVVLYHYESASKSPDGMHGLHAHSHENVEKLLEKWIQILGGSPASDEALFFGDKTLRRWKEAYKDLKRARSAHEAGRQTAVHKFLNKAIQNAQDQPQILSGCARIMKDLGEHLDAARLLEQAVVYAPSGWELRYQLVEAWLDAGQPYKAGAELEKLLAVFPDHPQLLEMAEKTGGLEAHHGQAPVAQASAQKAGETQPVHEMKWPEDHRAAETLELLLNSDDLPAALQEYAGRLDASLLELVRLNIRAAQADGDEDLVEGLENLAAYIEDAIAARSTTRLEQARETLEYILTAEDLPAALEACSDQLDETLLELVRQNLHAAREEGSLELAEGLGALAEYIQTAAGV